MTPSAKKRKAGEADGAAVRNGKKAAKTETELDSEDFTPLSLDDIRLKVKSLCGRVPKIPEDQFGANGSTIDETNVKEWAAQLQAVLEEFNLLVCCVATAAYKWGTDRSGAADQNLSLLSGELGSSQEQIASTVTPRLTNVLAPVGKLSCSNKVITIV